MGDLSQQLKHRLDTIQFLSDFDLQSRIKTISNDTHKLLCLVEILRGISGRARENGKSVKLSVQEVDQIVALLEHIGFGTLLSCHTTESGLKKMVENVKMHNLRKEFLDAKGNGGSDGESDNAQSK